MLIRDMVRLGHEVGFRLESDDGIHWSELKISFLCISHYVDQPISLKYWSKYGRFERSQILMQNGKSTLLFVTSRGGTCMIFPPFVFEIEPKI